MTTVRAGIRSSAIGVVPIALLIALWHCACDLRDSRRRSLLPAPRTVFLRLARLLGDPHFLSPLPRSRCSGCSRASLIAVVLGVAFGIAAAGSRPVGAAAPPAHPGAGAGAEDRALSGLHADAWVSSIPPRSRWSPRTRCSRSCSRPIRARWRSSRSSSGRRGRRAFRRCRCLFTVVLPAALPSILTGCRIGLVISCIVVFLAEMITSTDGLGHLLVRAARNFQTVDMFVPLITISLLGLHSTPASMHCARACWSVTRRKPECWPTASKANGSTPSARFSRAAR